VCSSSTPGFWLSKSKISLGQKQEHGIRAQSAFTLHVMLHICHVVSSELCLVGCFVAKWLKSRALPSQPRISTDESRDRYSPIALILGLGPRLGGYTRHRYILQIAKSGRSSCPPVVPQSFNTLSYPVNAAARAYRYMLYTSYCAANTWVTTSHPRAS
jgi:hypothetical protein